ncbi:MAG: orotidine-5'-phosphate decarboxylase [Planctomycetota bacterium]|nr:orotidine-5'-phosphate decarboxylase [Planctomycetota bacterium]
MALDPHEPGRRLRHRLEKAAAPVCVGLDPVAAHMPDELAGLDPLDAVERFCEGVLAAIRGRIPCVKVQSACFERYGHRGVAVLERVLGSSVEMGFETILDSKRGDIGISASHYAAATAATGAGWVTVNGYLGEDGITPFLDEGLGVFVLVRTRNPSGDEIQSPSCGDGTVASLVARMVGRLGGDPPVDALASVGAVVGATKPEAAAALRSVMPRTPFLLPGYGAQGGGADGVRAALDPAGSGVLVTASRSIIRAWQSSDAGASAGESWTDAVSTAADRFIEEIAGVVDGSIA